MVDSIWMCLKAKTRCQRLYNQMYHRIDFSKISHSTGVDNDRIYLFNKNEIHISTYNYYQLMQALVAV